jgi:hypothetical protein
MASNQDFIFTLGADISQFTKSITEVRAELNRVKSTLKNQTGQAIVETNQYIQQLEGSLDSLNKVGLKNLGKSTQGGTAALFSLSQVARDLPFGFIAIQNNLPLVIDQFSTLSKTSGGLGKALGQVGNALAGPAGVAFAFGALTSIITSLVQEYGSLENAFGQVFGTITKAKIATDEYTKSSLKAKGETYAEAQSVNNLLGILKNGNATYQQRTGAYEKLKSVMPDVLAGFDKEKIINGEQITQLESLAKLKLQNITLDATRQSLIELIGKYTGEALIQIDKLGKTSTFENLKNQLAGMLKGFPPFMAGIMQQISVIEEDSNAVDGLNKMLVNIDAQIASNTGKITANTDAYLKQKKAIEDAAKAQGYWLGFAPAAVIAGDEFNNAVKKSAKNLEGWRYIIEQVAIKSAELKTNLDGVANTAIKISNTSFDQLFESLQNQDMLFGIQEVQRGVNKVFKGMDDDMKANQQRFENYKSVIENFITAPLDYLFNTVLEGGKFSWKEFGNVVLRVLANIISSIIATTAAAAIANAIVPGAGTAGVNAYNQSSRLFGRNMQGGMSPSLGYTPRGLGGAANFGGLSGGLGLSGQVVFVQRGSDLVGVLNRSNATINRVG